MSKKIQSKMVYCEAKRRHVQIERSVSGPWYNRRQKVEQCPAVGDAGQPCDQACVHTKASSLDARLATVSPWGTRRWV
jgi:hypothetical protein